MTNNTKQITLENISKVYDGRYVLKSVNEEFSAGKSIAFVGHNGCGKSTLLKIISRLVTPTSGKVDYTTPLHFSYVPEKFMPLKLSARKYLRRMGEIEGISKNEIERIIKKHSEDFFVDEMLDVSMHSLSKGTLQKIGVIQAIMKKPDVLLLDEPLSGQDRSSQKVFVHKINELRNQGTTIFMSCHEQALVNAISEQVFTIEKGNVIRYEINSEHTFSLIFENPLNKQIVNGMEKYGTGYRLILNEDKVQNTIMKLIQEGWKLKGLYDNDTETDEI